MSIGRISQREVFLADADESVHAAAQRMRERGTGTLLVLDDERRPVGILTDRDVALRAVADNRDPRRTQVEEVMTAHPRTIGEHAPIEDALGLMRSLGVRRLPVVDASGRLEGIVSLDDVIALLVEEMRSIQGVLAKDAPHGMLV